ncbi:hypothetical protein [Listeria cornellensis]|uniref:Uncharacterized protein n=1 Tax=Listeria cornellensis FSL F6-0969 TaxID=1265820 RepID=W7BS92_9LIST|nr:hypothetical protein [Listeria cornellensis]EUJ29624.1 hypothetical protein PCORN_10777 [Listeria cornellensis FSL F6-0969]
MKVRQTIVNEYEAVQYTADMVTGYAYMSELVRFAGYVPKYFPKKDSETIEEAHKRIRAENNYMRPRDLVKYYKHTNGEVIIKPEHRALYVFKHDGIFRVLKRKFKQAGYEIIEEDVGK